MKNTNGVEINTIDRLTAHVLKQAKKFIVVTELVFIESKIFHVAGYSECIVFGGMNPHIIGQQRITYHITDNSLEISLHTVNLRLS